MKTRVEVRPALPSSTGAVAVLKSLNFPDDLISACKVVEDPSVPKAFVHFPADLLMQALESYANWETGYYAGSISDIQTAITHGSLLQKDDLAARGRVLNELSREKNWFDGNPGVCVFSQYHDAWTKSSGNLTVDRYDCAVLVVKLRPGAFTTIPHGKATQRRGCHFLYGLLISGNGFHDQTVPRIVEQLPADINPPVCPYALSCYGFLVRLDWPAALFCNEGYRCYCSDCFPAQWLNSMQVAEETYVIPRGWCRFGVKVNSVLAKYNKIWDRWANAFHGTKPENALSIVKHGQLLMRGDTLMDGRQITPHAAVDPQQQKYFLSPHIDYMAHPWYSEITPFRKVEGKQTYCQVILAMKVRPHVISKQAETEGGARVGIDEYKFAREDEISWFSACRGSAVPYGVLIRVFDDRRKAEIERTAASAADGQQRIETSISFQRCKSPEAEKKGGERSQGHKPSFEQQQTRVPPRKRHGN